MGLCGSKYKNTEVEVLSVTKESLAPIEVIKDIKDEDSSIRQVNPLSIFAPKPEPFEKFTPLDMPGAVGFLSGQDLLIDDLQHKVKQQRTLMHEGRNIRAASLGHLQASMEAMKQSMDELRALLSTKPSEAVAVKLQASLAAMEKAYHLQKLSQAGELYTSIIENYLLSPDDKEEFSLIAWVNSMVDMLSSEALIPLKKEGLLALSTEYIVQGHKAVLLYSLVNLMQNAIKFTKPKLSGSLSAPLEIAISLHEDNGNFWFSIIDHGIGMDAEQVAHCLDRTHKRFTSIQGSGSGLSAVSSALKKVGGHLSVTSTKDLGTNFKLMVPLNVLSRTTPLVDYSKLSVLVADDGILNLKLATKMLRHLGIPLESIYTVSSTQDALLAFKRQYNLGRPINVILTDLNMGSGKDGFEIAEEVRHFEERNRFAFRTRILIVSGTTCSTEKGFEFTDGQLPKPINKDDLALQLSKAITPNPTTFKKQAWEAETPTALLLEP